MKQSVVFASGSDETESYTPREAALISEAIAARGLTVLDAGARPSDTSFSRAVYERRGVFGFRF